MYMTLCNNKAIIIIIITISVCHVHSVTLIHTQSVSLCHVLCQCHCVMFSVSELLHRTLSMSPFGLMDQNMFLHWTQTMWWHGPKYVCYFTEHRPFGEMDQSMCVTSLNTDHLVRWTKICVLLHWTQTMWWDGPMCMFFWTNVYM